MPTIPLSPFLSEILIADHDSAPLIFRILPFNELDHVSKTRTCSDTNGFEDLKPRHQSTSHRCGSTKFCLVVVLKVVLSTLNSV